jgi:hypothetical protein
MDFSLSFFTDRSSETLGPQPSSLVQPPHCSKLHRGTSRQQVLLAGLLISRGQAKSDCIAAVLTATHWYELVTQGGVGARWGKSGAHLHVPREAGRSEWPPELEDESWRCGEGGLLSSASEDLQ